MLSKQKHLCNTWLKMALFFSKIFWYAPFNLSYEFPELIFTGCKSKRSHSTLVNEDILIYIEMLLYKCFYSNSLNYREFF